MVPSLSCCPSLYPTSSNSIQSQLRVVQALDVDNRHKADDLPRQLSWFHEGQYIAQDVARGLYFLHNIDVRFGRAPSAAHDSLHGLGSYSVHLPLRRSFPPSVAVQLAACTACPFSVRAPI